MRAQGIQPARRGEKRKGRKRGRGGSQPVSWGHTTAPSACTLALPEILKEKKTSSQINVFQQSQFYYFIWKRRTSHFIEKCQIDIETLTGKNFNKRVRDSESQSGSFLSEHALRPDCHHLIWIIQSQTSCLIVSDIGPATSCGPINRYLLLIIILQ